jgi:hypothetical protein
MKFLACKGSSSFLKKRTKKLLLSVARVDLAFRVNQQSKSFLVRFFKKELPSCWPCLTLSRE